MTETLMTNFRKLDTASLRSFNYALRNRLELVPVGLIPVFWQLKRKAGAGPTIKLFFNALRNGARSNDIRRLIAGNLKRKRIRLPYLFRFVQIERLYGHFKGMQAALLRDLLLLDACPDTIDIIFNGSVFPESVLQSVSSADHRVLIEAGFLPQTLQIDPIGLNGANSVPRDPAFYLADEVDFTKLGLPSAVGRRTAKALYAPIELPESFIFVPFQVPSDMQITVHSPWIRDMEHFFEVLSETVENNPNEIFVVKEHPSCRSSIRKKVFPHPRIIFANGNETQELITKSRAILTINSTVGIEALQAAKPVIAIGISCYDILGLVLRANDQCSLDFALGERHWRPDEELRLQFLGFLNNIYLVDGTFSDPPADLAQLILNCLNSGNNAWGSKGA